jgi:hypothetical protein
MPLDNSRLLHLTISTQTSHTHFTPPPRVTIRCTASQETKKTFNSVTSQGDANTREEMFTCVKATSFHLYIRFALAALSLNIHTSLGYHTYTSSIDSPILSHKRGELSNPCPAQRESSLPWRGRRRCLPPLRVFG